MRVVIIGGGFGGISAAQKLHNKLSFENDVEIILIDKNEYTTMLPSLPDISGNRVKYKYAKAHIEKVIPRGVKFLNLEVNTVDFINKAVTIGDKKLNYDYLIFSPGSKTDTDEVSNRFKHFYKLDSLEDALKIREDFYRSTSKNEITNVVIAGAGYTGVELACGLRHFATENDKRVTITLVEKSDRVLSSLKPEVSKYAMDTLRALDIDVLTEDEITSIEGEGITLKSNKNIENVFLCWCGGVKMSLAVSGKHKALKDGRIVVDEYLRIPEHPEVFVVGDAAAVKYGNEYLRRAMSYAFQEGKCAGRNIAAMANGEGIKVFKPAGHGWIIPLYSTSIGTRVKGKSGLFLHYMSCGLKNYNGRNTRKYLRYGITLPFVKIDKSQSKGGGRDA